jgi:hypothetical protein
VWPNFDKRQSVTLATPKKFCGKMARLAGGSPDHEGIFAKPFAGARAKRPALLADHLLEEWSGSPAGGWVGQVALRLDLTAQRSLCGVAIFRLTNNAVA